MVSVGKLGRCAAAIAVLVAIGGGAAMAGQTGTSGLLFSTFFQGDVGAIARDGTGNIYIAGAASTATPTTDGTTYSTALMTGNTYVAKLDPTGSKLLFSTILPSSIEYPSVAVDGQGNVYVTGREFTGNSRAVYTQRFGASAATTYAPVVKIDPSGQTLYHVLVGGSGWNDAWAIAVDGLGNVYVAGRTTSADYPTTSGAFDRTWAGGTDPSEPYDAFVYKLNADASSLAYSTFLGGAGQDEAHGLAVDANGNAYVAGNTGSSNFPTTSGAFQTTAKGGGDLFVTKLNPQGSALVYSTLLGSSGPEYAPLQNMLALDDAGDAFVGAMSDGPDYPVTSNAIQPAQSAGSADAVVTALNNTGTALLFSTYLGGSAGETVTGIALAGPSRVAVGGYTSSADYPITPDAFQPALMNGIAGTVSVLDYQNGQLAYSTYLGAADPANWTQIMTMTADGTGDVYAGGTTPPEYPTTPGSYDPSASSSVGFVTKLVPGNDLAFGKPATSSSNENSSLGPANAVDGSYTTRWSSQFSDPQWLAIDLGSQFDLTRVVLHWETAYATAYQIQVSNDGASWTTIAGITSGDGNLDDVPVSGSGRYLRIYGTARATVWGYSLWEVEAYGTPTGAGTNTPPTVALTSPVNGTTMTAPASVTVSASASDSDGSVARVDFYQNGAKIASVTSPPYSTTASDLGVGTYTFYAVATDNLGASTASSAATVTVNGASGALPSPWQDANLKPAGAPVPPGSASFSNGTFTIDGVGYSIGDTNDYGNFVYQSTGNADIVARVTTVQNTSGAAGAGVMFRGTLDASAAEVSLIVRPTGSVDMLARATAGSSYTQTVATVAAGLPVWLHLAWTDPWFNAYISTDGSNWTFVGSIRVPLGTSALVGLIATSGSGTSGSTSTMDSVAVGGQPAGGGGGSGVPSPWVSNDVGAVGVAGSTTYGNGTFTVEGSGADIWGTADAFQYASQPMGDGQIVARVTAEQNTSAYAKAGVMLRETMAADAADVLLDVKPDGGVELMSRPSTGASTNFVAGGSVSFPAWLKLVRSGATVTGYVSSDGTNWTTIGSTTTSMAATANIGLAVTSHDNTVLNTSTFDSVTVSAASGGTTGLPAPWASGDVGTVGVAGKSSAANGTFTVSGSGADIWGTADAFQYAYQSIGNGQIVARVTAEQNTSAYAKAGVMLRETLDAGSADVILDIKPDGGIELMTRSATGGTTAFVGGASAAFPVWLKLARSGSTVTGYVSSDGVTWTTVGSVTTSMAATANIGLAVTSHDNTTLNTATFDNVTVTPQ